ncbi:DUF1850 domain-containing protein [Desulfomonile tiedjei]|uniref:DUF1850 domain-containing protein n=1 Tax=Desulfomonile tiedjei (strain ATCC 49306 / DSM 6799 / DCB-1) TaxID=706587 RepID=I4C546_DESTA|nr:DUF1850 domain-containing protein [Desulfomonile tiedjei]AFM24687.1 protein of unknown function (DUF1850) [Desulfomonile tiedjei DSM 6799]
MKIAAVICLLSYLCLPIPSLVVRSSGTNDVLWAVPVLQGSVFRITWTHSVSRRVVSEDYVIGSDGRLCLRRMTFDHEGPNLPSSPEEGLSWKFDGDRIIVTGYERCMKELNLGIASEFHQLQSGPDIVDFVTLSKNNRVFRVSTEPIAAVRLFTLSCGNIPSI